MNLIRIYGIILLYLLLSLKCSAQVAFSEAEHAQFEGLELIADSTASGGEFLRIADSGYIKWTFNIEAEGWYNLVIGYKCTGGSKVELIDVNGFRRPYGFGYSEEWNRFAKPFELVKGENVISIEPDWGFIDIDYLVIDPVKVSPTLKPLNNNFYLSQPRNLVYKINRFGESIKAVEIEGRQIDFTIDNYPYQADAIKLFINKQELSSLLPGDSRLNIIFQNSDTLTSLLHVTDEVIQSDLKIIAPYVEHGSAVLAILPNGKTLLIDCAKDWVRDSILIPLIRKNNITKVDYFILTHYHDDHDSGDKGETIKTLFNVDKFYDYKSLNTGDTLNLGGVKLKVLNSFDDGNDENTSSLAFTLSYNGFVYNHGGDTYAVNQVKMAERFPDDIKADVFYANHHFHGSVDIDYLRKLNPAIVLLQAQEAIYARSAYADDYKTGVEKYLLEHSDKYIEDLPTLETGTVVVRITSGKNWSYETYPDLIPEIPSLKN